MSGALVVSREMTEALRQLADAGREDERARAFRAILDLTAEESRAVFQDPATPRPALEYVAGHVADDRMDLVEALFTNPALPDDFHPQIVESVTGLPAANSAEAEARLEAEAHTAEEDVAPPAPRQTLVQRIAALSTPERIRLALLGTNEERLALLRDRNRIIARAVVMSPKITRREVEAYASMLDLAEEVFRFIAKNRVFMKNYRIVRTLIANPRVPLDITLHLVPRLKLRDLRDLRVNRNVPTAIRNLAARLVEERQ